MSGFQLLPFVLKTRPTRRRWSDNDRSLWRFTYAHDRLARFGLMLDTGCAIEGDSAALRLHALGRTLLFWLPSIFKLGREYGAFYSEGAVHLHYGPRMMDSSAEKSRCWFVPWLNWKFVRKSVYGLRGEHIATENDGTPWQEWHEIEKACPFVSFDFHDFDGEFVQARTRIEEREWRLGTGRFRWLSWFRRPRVRRSLDIEFSKETGRRKGSWKGGTIGHGIDMQPGELHEAAFRRYCAEHEMEFLGESPEEVRP